MADVNANPGATTVVPDPKRPWKAIAGAVVTFLGLLWAALEGKQDRLGSMTLVEWLSVLVPTILTFAAVYGIPNPKVVVRR
jgi:hypothetical protein